MNRNAAILGLTTSAVALALLLAWCWRGASMAAETPGFEPAARADESLEAAPPVLDRGLSEPERRATEVPAEASTANSDGDADGEEARPDPEPVLVAGWVVDQDRSPVPGARVIVVSVPLEGFPMRRLIREGTSDRQGQFEIRGTVEPLELEAHATKDRYFDSDPQAFTRGATDVQLVVREGGVVAGRLLLDPWVPSEKIRVIVQPIGAREAVAVPSFFREPAVSVLRLSPGGKFAQSGIAAPTVVLAVRVENDPWDAIRLEGVPVRTVMETQDSRLDPIDLRGQFELVDVVVLDEGGARVDGARVHLRNPADTSSDCSRSTSGGHAQFLTRSGAHDFEIERDGYRVARLEGVYGDQIVRLRNGIPVQITLRGAGPRPTPPDRIAVALLRGTDKQGKQLVLGGIGTFEDPRTTRIVVSTPGTYEVAWYLDHGRNRQYLTGGPGRTVLVRDTDELQELVLEFPSEALAAMR